MRELVRSFEGLGRKRKVFLKEEQKKNDGTNFTEEKENTWEYANVSTIPIGMGHKAKSTTPTSLSSGKTCMEPREELHFDLLDFIPLLWTISY